MISLQTNVDSLNAQRNLGIDNQFQSKTIQQLTSGYRINSSGDDAAGLAIANTYRSSIAELNQGVANSNDGISQLQIIDGGLNNISTLLDRLKTLATQSATSTFSGDRNTLNQEYQQVTAEISRQASNIGLNQAGRFNTNLSVYIGGADISNTAGSGTVNVDLSGTTSAVDATSLALATTNVAGGGVDLGAVYTATDATTAAQTFKLFTADGQTSTITAAAGKSVADTLTALNSNASAVSYGVNFTVDANNHLRVSSSQAFSLYSAATAGGILPTGIAAGAQNTAKNTAVTGSDFVALAGATSQALTLSGPGGASATVTIAAGDSISTVIQNINANAAVKKLGITAVEVQTGATAGTNDRISFQSDSFFTTSVATTGTATANTGFDGTGNVGTLTAADTTQATTGNAAAAITAIDAAIKTLGLVQGKIGAGENKLQYASQLAQSQISGFSAAEAQIRDTNVAEQAANLTKAQVLTQTAVAALAQANAEPQSVLKLLQ